MTILQALILGLVQGLAEFLPVSSSGHLVIVPWLMDWPRPDVTFDVLLHLGTLIAAVVYFRSDIIALLVAWWQSLRQRRLINAQARLAWLLIVSTIPAALAGYFLEEQFESLFQSPVAVAALLAVTGILLWVSEYLGHKTKTLDQAKLPEALIMGLAQGLAVAPGLSRAGTVMAAGLFCGLKREAAARYSFILGMPIILGAAGYKLLKAAPHVVSSQIALWSVGFVAALVSGYVAMHFLLKYVRSHSLRPFAVYCWVISLVVLIISIVR